LLVLGFLGSPRPDEARVKFDLDTVAEKARKLAQESYQEPKGVVPDFLLKLDYDKWRDVRFRPDRALWRERRSRFQVQFFHPGLFYDRPVAINVVRPDGVRPLPFSPSLFDYGKNEFGSRVPQDLGYAGFRLHYPIKSREYLDEIIVFLGATYFRAVGRDHVFGLSARGLAIDTAESRGEEFPWFKEFWLVQPLETAKSMTLYALLDSPRVTGAYRFVVTPGEQTTVAVECRLFLRGEVRKLGIAPLTSMFFHGENSVREVSDFHPETHDSDGLLIAYASGEWLWRPIDNPRTLSTSAFRMEKTPRGFGLLQRDRDWDHYQDLETRPDLRPSVWIEPQGNWGSGRVEVVEIPTNTDSNDNIVTYWVPEQAPRPGEPVTYGYTLSWFGDDPSRPPGGRVVATRRDQRVAKDAHRIVVDFAGPKLSAIPGDRVIRGVVTILGGEEAGELLGQHVLKNDVTGGWRLTFQVRPKKREPLELRAYLDEGGETLTETWSYAILP
jgi:glucans biosynthesis protein